MKRKLTTQNAVSPQFKALRWRLLGSFLIVMLTIRAISNIVTYQFFARSLYQQLDNRLLNLAQSAAHSLVAMKQDRKTVDRTYLYRPDKDGDLDIPWQNLRKSEQNVEWFDAKKQRLASSGTLALTVPLKAGFQTIQPRKIRILTIPAYSGDRQEQKLEGYIRVSESTEAVEASLAQLRWGSYLGGAIALGLIGIGGMWLTKQSLKPIERSFWQLKQFTADASHELRSPLTAIKTSVEVMQTHPERIHPEDAEKLIAIVSATNQMTHLVEDLLLLARTDATTATSTQEWSVIPLNELLEDVVEFLEPKAQEKKILIESDWQTDIYVKGNTRQLLRLFSNLVENALQYTPEQGTVTISLRQADGFAVVSIEDTGIGITPEDISLIFNRFWRADKARSYRIEGSGLGLAIAQAIAQRHGGKITVTSKLGVGSCFQVHLSIAR